MVGDAEPSLGSTLSNRLALSMQSQQSLKILAMNSHDLALHIEQVLQSNPLLVLEEAEASTESDSEMLYQQNDVGCEDGIYGDASRDWDMAYEGVGLSHATFDGEQQWPSNVSLSDALHEQLNQQPMSAKRRVIAHAIIDSLDDDGYCRVSLDSLLRTITLAEVELSKPELLDVLQNTVQELEPAGIGAQDLLECLLLQLHDAQPMTVLARQMLLYHSDILADDAALLSKLGCNHEALMAAWKLLRRLDPYPGHGLRGLESIYIQPEVIFRIVNQQLEIDVPQSACCGVTLSQRWLDQQWQGKDKLFMQAAKQEAKGLVYALHRRSETLMKVALYLGQRQRLFLEHGILALKPLTLHEVAKALGLHESTISRVTYGKYAQTPLGLIEMRSFFSAGLPLQGGGVVSVHRVQQRLKSLIKAEVKDCPVSDQVITERLQAEGIEITRRTVAKYRNQLGLLSSSQRRRAAKACLSQSRGK